MTEPQVEKARAQFTREGLPFPPVPAPLEARLRAAGEHVFATREIAMGPYSIEHFTAEIDKAPSPADYALLGFDGYGIDNWAVHYYLVEDALALFVQLPWGGAYTDADEARARIVRVFAWAQRLQARVRQAREQALIPDGRRLVAVVSTFVPARFAWLPALGSTAPAEADSESTNSGNLLTEIDAAVDQLFARGAPPEQLA